MAVRRGSSGAEVRRIQQWLKDNGWWNNDWPVDGKFGPNTESAVRNFQESMGAKVDGIWGPETQWYADNPGGGAYPQGARAGDNAPATSGSGSGGSAGGSGTSGGTSNANLRDSEFWPYLQPLFESGDPELRALAQRAFDGKWSAERVAAEVRGTNYFKNTADRRRQWDLTPAGQRGALVAEAAAGVLQRLYDVYGRDWVVAHGLDSVNNAQVQQYATDLASGRRSKEEFELDILRNALTDPNTEAFLRNQAAQRERAKAKAQPRDLAEDTFNLARRTYNVTMSREQAADWGQKLATGALAEADLRDYLRNQAATRFEADRDSIMKGIDPATVNAPYIEMAARELERSADDVVVDDRIFGSPIAGVNGQKPTLSEYRQYIRGLPEWKGTRAALTEVNDWADTMLTELGQKA